MVSGNPSGPLTSPTFERFSDDVAGLLYGDRHAGIGAVAAHVAQPHVAQDDAQDDIEARHKCSQHTVLHENSIRKAKEAESTIG